MSSKLRVLCLHGCRQDVEKFTSQTGGLRKILKQTAEFTYVPAPHVFKDTEVEQRSWWFSKPNYFNSRDETDDDTGFDKSLELIQNVFSESGPFNGILGFSQGAALAAILCSLKETKQISIDFQFAVIVSGFKSKCSKHSIYYNTQINIPSLHIIGEKDEIVNKSKSEELASLFINPKIEYHEGGHYVPSSSMKESYRNFFNKQKNSWFVY